MASFLLSIHRRRTVVLLWREAQRHPG